MTSIRDWAEDHCEFNTQEESNSYIKAVEVEVGTHVEYQYKGRVFEFRNLPADYIIDTIDRVEFDDDGNEVSRVIVLEGDCPKIDAEAVRLAVEVW